MPSKQLLLPYVVYVDAADRHDVIMHLFKHKGSNTFFRVGYSSLTEKVYICIPHSSFMPKDVAKVVAREYVSNLKSGFFIPGKVIK